MTYSDVEITEEHRELLDEKTVPLRYGILKYIY